MEALSLEYANARAMQEPGTLQGGMRGDPERVNSTARAVWSAGIPSASSPRAKARTLGMSTATFYIDYLLGLGPMIPGHRPPQGHRRRRRFHPEHGTVFALPHAEETKLARK